MADIAIAQGTVPVSLNTVPIGGLPQCDHRSQTEKLLREEASRVLQHRLTLIIPPDEVKFNGKPFPKRRTVYIWRAHGNLTPKDRKVLARTVQTNLTYRSFWRWSERDRKSLTLMIQNEVLRPEFYTGESPPYSVDGQQFQDVDIGTEAGSSKDTDGSDNGVSDSDCPTRRSAADTRPSKRRRILHFDPRFEDSGISLEPDTSLLTNYSTDREPISSPKHISTRSNPLSLDGTVIELVSRPQPSHPTADELAASASPRAQSQSRTPSVTPPRLMKLNSMGVLEYDASSVAVPTARTWPPAQAPIAASPVADSTEAASWTSAPSSQTIYELMDAHATETKEDQRFKQICLQSTKSLQQSMAEFIEQTTVGYLQSLEQRKEMRRMSLKYQTEVTQQRESIETLHSRIAVLEGDLAGHVKDKEDLNSNIYALTCERDRLHQNINSLSSEFNFMSNELAALRENNRSLVCERENIQMKTATLENRLAICDATEVALKSDILALRHGRDVAIDELSQARTQKNSLERQAQSLLAGNNDLWRKNSILKGEKRALEGEKQALEGEKHALEGEKQALQALQGEKHALEGEKRGLENEKHALEGEKHALEGVRTNLEDIIAHLIVNREVLSRKLQAADKSYKDLRDKLQYIVSLADRL
ncbi:hypothetical protein DRE_07244 [Drechslerella stenobrocha 248]|uniref:Uncharacterized protein n=1 Tax=Drechslerella stenobrocha 248 TaxID=1043628 RepID=W7HUY7_9PEZI|nr:hypothetical protein DRE_07244 [Drechslerella stenobrocha 248]